MALQKGAMFGDMLPHVMASSGAPSPRLGVGFYKGVSVKSWDEAKPL